MPSRHPSLTASLVAALLLVLSLPPAALSRTEARRGLPPMQGGGGTPLELFSPCSIWNQALPQDAPVDPASRGLVTRLVSEVASEEHRGWGPWITTIGSPSIYRVGPGQATVKVQLDNPTASWRASLQRAFAAVPIPADASPGAAPDSEMTIWQPSTDRLWEFYRARKLSDGWHAAWGGAIEHVSQSPGYYTDTSWPGSGDNWGATATSLPVAAGTITIADLLSGHIDHAVAVDVPYARAGVFAWPAQRTDGTSKDPETLPEGAHLRLDPGLDLDTLKLPPLVRMIAVAAQRYGMVVRDQTHHAIGFFVEDPRPSGHVSLFYGPQGPSPSGLYEGKYPGALLASFPWGSLQVLRMDLHRQ